MRISPLARETAERIARMKGDPLAERGMAELIQSALEIHARVAVAQAKLKWETLDESLSTTHD